LQTARTAPPEQGERWHLALAVRLQGGFRTPLLVGDQVHQGLLASQYLFHPDAHLHGHERVPEQASAEQFHLIGTGDLQIRSVAVSRTKPTGRWPGRSATISTACLA